MRVRTSGWLAAAALAFGSLLGASSARASATSSASATSPLETIEGDFSYPRFGIQVYAERLGGQPATAALGYVIGSLSLGGAKVGDFDGAVTCLDVEGNSAGLFYPVQSADPGVLAVVPLGMLVTVTRTSTGKPLGVSLIPVPSTHVSSCAPMKSTLFPITSGQLSFTPGIASTTPVAPASTLGIADDVPLGQRGTQDANVLTNAAGYTVYTLRGETTRHPKCTKAGRCIQIWRPVTVGSSVKPTLPSNVTGRLGVWRRDGFRQVTLGGHPLYTFGGDTLTGEARGAGIHSFGGTWSVIKTPASLTAPSPTTPSGTASQTARSEARAAGGA